MEINNLTKFYKNKKIFITGHTGFKGIWLYLILNFLGAKVKGYSLKPKKNDNFLFFRKIKKKINSDFGDILDYKKLEKSLKKFNPEIIFHLAAQSLVLESQRDPEKTFKTNIVGTYNLLEIANNLKNLRSIIIATSDKCYENKENKNFFDENSKLGGNEPYSQSKALTEHLLIIFKKNFLKLNICLSSVRAGNVIGGGDFSKYRIIPDIFRSLKHKKVILRNPLSIRPWQHVFDVCKGYLLIPPHHYKNKKYYSGPYNIGPLSKKFMNVSNLTKNFIKFFDDKIIIKKKKSRFVESKYLLLNSNKIKTKLKWKPKYSVYDSLKLSSDWYLAYLKKKDISEFSYFQIKKFFNS